MPHVRMRLIGGFELSVDGRVLDGLQPATQRLLAFVALAPHGVDRAFTALQLWPDATEDRARANLRSAMWRVRRLPAGLLLGTSSRLRLDDGVWVDTRQGLLELVEGRDGGAVATTLPFQSLMGDLLLPDWYDEWLEIERERLRQLCLRLLESRAERALAAGDPSGAIQLALAAVSIEPLRESAHRILVHAHRAEGNEREARRTIDSYRARARASVGV